MATYRPLVPDRLFEEGFLEDESAPTERHPVVPDRLFEEGFFDVDPKGETYPVVPDRIFEEGFLDAQSIWVEARNPYGPPCILAGDSIYFEIHCLKSVGSVDPLATTVTLSWGTGPTTEQPIVLGVDQAGYTNSQVHNAADPSEDIYEYTISRDLGWPENITITVRVEGADNVAPPNTATIEPPAEWWFCTTEAELPPYIDNEVPAPGAMIVSQTANIALDILDTQAGVDLSSVLIEIDFGIGYQTAYDGSSDSFLAPYNGPSSARGGVPAQYTWVIDPTFVLPGGAEIFVRVSAQDLGAVTLVPNPTIYSFFTVDDQPPYVDDEDPYDGEAGVAIDKIISFTVNDNIQVDQVTLHVFVQVNGGAWVLAVDNGVLVVGTDYDVIGSSVVAGGVNGFLITLDHATDFPLGSLVAVRVKAYDTSGYLVDEVFSFTVTVVTDVVLEPAIVEKDGGYKISVTAPVATLPTGRHRVEVDGTVCFSGVPGQASEVRATVHPDDPSVVQMSFVTPFLALGTYDVTFTHLDTGAVYVAVGALQYVPHTFRSGVLGLRRKLLPTWGWGYVDADEEDFPQ